MDAPAAQVCPACLGFPSPKVRAVACGQRALQRLGRDAPPAPTAGAFSVGAEGPWRTRERGWRRGVVRCSPAVVCVAGERQLADLHRAAAGKVRSLVAKVSRGLGNAEQPSGRLTLSAIRALMNALSWSCEYFRKPSLLSCRRRRRGGVTKVT